MKIYIPYLKNPDTFEYDQPLGAFDSIEKCQAELEKFADNIEIDVNEIDYEIESYILNINILLSNEQIMK